jgi:hypothetical protein
VSALRDAVVRVWLVIAAWLGLRRAAPLQYLASIGHPRRLLRAAIVPAGRHFALAIAFLPRAQRDEATIAFLACKALDAFEDLSADRAAARRDLQAAVGYLVGASPRPPRPPRAPRAGALGATRESDRLEALLAARLPLLRAALEALPADGMRRCHAIIEKVGAGMVRACRDRRRYADDVLGETVVHAARVVAPEHRPPVTACKAAGRALQLANDLRDAETAHARDVLLYQALPDLPLVPRLLRWLPPSVSPGTRAAATLVVVTTCAFYLRQIAAEVPRGLRHPLRAAIAAACSRRAYLTTVAAIEQVLRDALGAVAAAGAVGAVGAVGRRLDVAAPAPALAPPLPAGTPDAVGCAVTLVSLAMDLVHTVPRAGLDAATPAQPGRAVVLADYLLFHAIEQLTSLRPSAIAEVATLLEQLAGPADRDELARSTALAQFAEEVAR